MCGEHNGACPRANSRPGSSPRVRGTLIPGMMPSFRIGIIPACAGNTHRCCTSESEKRDHPRVCGEHLDGNDPARNVLGSSPRVRGTRFARRSALLVSGDHPRVCGEHTVGEKQDVYELGSSPRVRGTLPPGRAQDQACGIIPACAGNTPATGTKALPCRDHPRVCGEHHGHTHAHDPLEGSSPRVRGTH